jgi:two-component system nitrogen regulation sensor histidine kinase NtrY
MEKKSQRKFSPISPGDLRRRKREAFLIPFILLALVLATFAESKIIRFGSGIPISNTILMFLLININLILLLLLIFLVFRNLVKLLYDRKRRVMGSMLRTRLVVGFIALTLAPSIILFFFSINFITNSFEFWFNVPVEQALENSLQVGRRLYSYVEDHNRFFLERAAYQIDTRNLLESGKGNTLANYIQVVQRAFHLHAVEVYSLDSERLTVSVAENLQAESLPRISAGDFQEALDGRKPVTIFMPSEGGELVRTISTVPAGVSGAEVLCYLVSTFLVPNDLHENLQSITRGYEGYQQIKLLKKPIQLTYYIALSIVGLLVVFCAIWFGFHLAKTLTIPIMDLAEGTRRVAEGDLTVEIEPVADDEIGLLTKSFNKMTRDLHANQNQLELTAQMLKERNIEIEERRRYMEIVLKNISAGVIALDAGGNITSINTSAERILHLNASEILNRSYRWLLKGFDFQIARDVVDKLNSSGENSVDFPLRIVIDGRPKSILVNITGLKDELCSPMGYVMVLDDLTELEKAQRLAAWREVARRIAHEVKNPLTPITLSAQRLRRKFSEQLNSSVFEECTDTIIDHVNLIRNLVNEFSTFARFPSANPKPCELLPIVEETLALYREGHPDIRFGLQQTDMIPRINLDRQHIKQAMINLVDNAVAAIRKNGTIEICLGYDAVLNRVRIEVADDGIGISDEVKTRLFEPNFSTKKTGTGLGLTIVNSIVADHRGVISVLDNKPQGARFVIELPA